MRPFLKLTPLAFALALAGAQVTNVGTAKLPAGCTNGQMPTYNTTTLVWDCTTPAAAATSTYTSTFASTPASPASGDVWFPSDSFYALRYSGSTWTPWGPIFPMTPPVDGDFAWINQGTATVATTNGGIYLSDAAATGNNLRLRKRAAPATPYVVTAAFLAAPVNPLYVGIGFRQSSDGKLSTMEVFTDGNGTRIGTSNWTSPTAYLGATSTFQFTAGPLFWFRIADDGVNRVCSLSVDGQNFITINSVGRTSHITADEIGFWINTGHASIAPRMTLLSWVIS